jgi:hypothetical protein
LSEIDGVFRVLALVARPAQQLKIPPKVRAPFRKSLDMIYVISVLDRFAAVSAFPTLRFEYRRYVAGTVRALCE